MTLFKKREKDSEGRYTDNIQKTIDAMFMEALETCLHEAGVSVEVVQLACAGEKFSAVVHVETRGAYSAHQKFIINTSTEFEEPKSEKVPEIEEKEF